MSELKDYYKWTWIAECNHCGHKMPVSPEFVGHKMVSVGQVFCVAHEYPVLCVVRVLKSEGTGIVREAKP